MKGNSSASILLKRIISLLSSIAKGQSATIKSKKNAVKARLIMFSLLKNKKLPAVGAISHKIHGILGRGGGGGGGGQQHDLHVHGQSCKASGAIVLHNANESISHDYEAQHEEEVLLDYYDYEDGDNKYPDLRHSLFEEFDHDQEEFNELLGGDLNASVIDLVRNSKEEEGQNFSLEDEIDHVADLFIMKVHKRMRMQKLESFKRYQDMLHRSSA